MIRERELLEAEKEQDAADAREVLANNPAATTPGNDVTAGGAWYLSTPVQVARGLADFRKKWGNRPNDDDWRRADKSGTALVDVAEETEETEAGPEVAANGEPAWKDPASYLKDIPETEAQLDSSNARICTALYLTGMIYKEKLRDVDNAIESFQVLNDRFEDCRYTPESNYQLYRIYLAKEKAGNFMDFGGASSQRYADLILERWPGSEFARLVQDPGQLEADEAAKAAEAEAYAALYAQFRQGAYRNVIAACDAVLDGQARNHLRPKYALLKAMAVGGLHMEAPFREALARISLDYPGTDEAKSAQALLDNLRKNDPEAAAPAPDAGEVAYTEPMGDHFVVFMVPDSAGPITNVKGAIARFNNQFFPGTPMEVSASIWDPHRIGAGKQGRELRRRAENDAVQGIFIGRRASKGGVYRKGAAVLPAHAGNISSREFRPDQAGLSEAEICTGLASFFIGKGDRIAAGAQPGSRRSNRPIRPAIGKGLPRPGGNRLQDSIGIARAANRFLQSNFY